MLTVVLAGPMAGVNVLIVGGSTVKKLADTAVPSGVSTVMGPVVAPTGSVVLMLVAELTVKLAGVPLKATAVAPVKRLPVSATLMLPGPLVGVKLLITGRSAQVSVVEDAHPADPIPSAHAANQRFCTAQTVE